MSLGLVSYGSRDDEGNSSGEELEDQKFVKNTSNSRIDDEDNFGFDEEFSTNSSLNLPPPKVPENSALNLADNDRITPQAMDGQEQLKFSVIPEPVANAQKEEVVEPELIIQAPAAEVALREKPPPKRKTVKIAALAFPTVDSDSDDGDAPTAKLSKPSGNQGKEKRTGLFSVLPPPRSSSQLFVPKIISSVQKPATKIPIVKDSDATRTSKKQDSKSNSMSKKPHSAGGDIDNSDDDESATSNFFSFGDDKSLPIVEDVPDFKEVASGSIELASSNTLVRHSVASTSQYAYDSNNTISASSTSQYTYDSNNAVRTNNSNIYDSTGSVDSTSSNIMMDWKHWNSNSEQTDWNFDSNSSSYQATDSKLSDYSSGLEMGQSSSAVIDIQDEQFLRMQGRKNRGKEINIRDIHAIEAPSILEITKNMTRDEELMPSHSNKDGPTSQQKRKHQITYLAHQAKEREFQLKNQWAENRMAKRQAQSKYGF